MRERKSERGILGERKGEEREKHERETGKFHNLQRHQHPLHVNRSSNRKDSHALSTNKSRLVRVRSHTL